MKLALCDDEPKYLKELSTLLEEYFAKDPQKKISISCFSQGQQLLEAVHRTGGYDIYFLDIIMPATNGILLGHELRKSGDTGIIIYLTSSPEYAIDSYRVRAYDYLLKPLNKTALFDTMNTLPVSAFSRRELHTIVKSQNGNVKINLDQIMYLQLTNRVIHYHLTNGTIIKSLYLRTSFTEAVSALLIDPFFLCSAGVVANLSHLTRMEDNRAIFCDKYAVDIGVRAFRSLKAAWVDYCINKESI